jgi:hypothetical protein
MLLYDCRRLIGRLHFASPEIVQDDGPGAYRVTESASGLSEDLLDLVIYGEAASLCFRKDHFAVDHDIELTGLTRLDLDFFTKAGIE